MTDAKRDERHEFPGDPDETRMDIALTREELGNTVEALARKADAPARAKELWLETTQPARKSIGNAADTVREATPEPVAQQATRALRAARQRPAILAFGGCAAVIAIGAATHAAKWRV